MYNCYCYCNLEQLIISEEIQNKKENIKFYFTKQKCCYNIIISANSMKGRNNQLSHNIKYNFAIS